MKGEEAMMRALIAALLVALFAVPAAAEVGCDEVCVTVTGGMMKPTGGDEDYEDSGLIMGIQVKKPLTESVWMALDYQHGQTATTGDPMEESRFSGWGEPDDFRTLWNSADVSVGMTFMPGERVNPFVSLGFGFTFWEVEDWRDAQPDEGSTPDGYDTDGKLDRLNGTNFDAVIGAGVDFWLNDMLSLTLGGRYRYLIQSDLDNVGWSSVYGADYVDANESSLEGYVGLAVHFGPGDCDEDGIYGRDDLCPRDPEDHDGWEDEDGCPDPDNDMDGILDIDDKCPDDAEDYDGDADEDGCPDIDRDGDGILDDDDKCPDEPEDVDGYKDMDGCPDPDNDMDGVPDVKDDCPDTKMGVKVDERGCEKPELMLYDVTVYFPLNSAKMWESEKEKLDGLIGILLETEGLEDVELVVQGYACDLGDSEYNMTLSEKRAKAVVMYLTEKGIDESLISKVMAFGETEPAVPNTSEANREKNRRVVVMPMTGEDMTE
jgi:outer membrane protein OmpA-like peptidoglycan-associated protein